MNVYRVLPICLILSGLILGRPEYTSAQDSDEIMDIDSEMDAVDSFDENTDFGDAADSEGEFGSDDFAEEKPSEEAPSEESPANAQESSGDEMLMADPVETMPAEDSLESPLEPQSEALETQAYEAPTYQSDDPDLNYEAKLHDIFLNYYNAKTPEAEWTTLVGERHSERYQIQQGDTLWDISKTLFGDGNYWPKVWSLNTSIKNPHLISPNNSIRFLLGDESEPPAFTVTENTAEGGISSENADGQVEGGAATNATSANASNGEDPEPEIPPPFKVSRPVVKKLPPSLPEWQDVAAQGNYDALGISYSRRKIADLEDTIPLQSYISENVPESFGEVKEIEVGNNLASAYQYVYVEMKKGMGAIGETYLVVANRGAVQSVNSSISGFLGYTIDVQGEIQLVEMVAGKNDSRTSDMYRALVLNIINPVGVGSSLIAGKLENIKISVQGPRSQVVAQIIGGSFFNRRQIYATESIAYLNRGEKDGLEVGQILPVRANRQVRDDRTQILSNIRPIGWLRIVKTTPHFATSVVVRSWSDILSGDITGAGEMLPQMESPVNGQSLSKSGESSLEAELEGDDFENDDTGFDNDDTGFDEVIDDGEINEDAEF